MADSLLMQHRYATMHAHHTHAQKPLHDHTHSYFLCLTVYTPTGTPHSTHTPPLRASPSTSALSRMQAAASAMHSTQMHSTRSVRSSTSQQLSLTDCVLLSMDQSVDEDDSAMGSELLSESEAAQSQRAEQQQGVHGLPQLMPCAEVSEEALPSGARVGEQSAGVRGVRGCDGSGGGERGSGKGEVGSRSSSSSSSESLAKGATLEGQVSMSLDGFGVK